VPRTEKFASGSASGYGALRTGTLVAGCFAICIAQLGAAIPATLNGLFQRDLHLTGSQLTWISDAFLLPLTVLQLTFGVLGDMYGRKRLLVGGAILMMVGEATAAASPGVSMLWLGQAIAGVGAAVIFPSSLAMLVSGSRSRDRRANVIAVWTALLSTGGFLAPVLGGVTGQSGSWKWSFVVVGSLAAAGALVGAAFAEDSRAPEGRSLDVGGQLTIGFGLFALLFVIIQGPTDGWSTPAVIAGYVLFLVCSVLFVSIERRTPSPLLRLELFRNRRFAVVSVVSVVGMCSYLGTCYAASIRLGPIQHQSTVRTAIALVPLSAMALLMIPLTARLLIRVPPRWLLSIGFATIAVGDFLIARLPVALTALPALMVPLTLVGIGFALAVSSVTATAVNTVPLPLAGMASAATSLFIALGFTLGPAVVGAVSLSRAESSFGSALVESQLPSAVKAVAGQISTDGGPLAVASAPPESLPGRAGSLAVEALGHGFTIGFIVCGVAASVCCLLTVLMLRGSDQEPIGLVPSPNVG